jgi:transcriptional regulator with XRE-family HTH domain
MVPLTSKRLADVRKALGLTQEKMAQLLGVSFVSVNRWEGGHSSPIGATLDLYEALGAAVQSGHKPHRILSSVSGDRGVFLLHLFTLAYGRKRGAA